MKADLPLMERRRMETEQRLALRASLVRSHFEVMDGEQALAGGQLLADLQMVAAMRDRPKVRDTLFRTVSELSEQHVASVPAPEVEVPRAKTQDLRAMLGLK